MTVSATHLQAAAFRSDLGWIGLEWRGRALTRSTFGHHQKKDVVRALGSDRVIQKGGLTPAQQQLIDRLLAFSQGAPETFSDVRVDLSEVTEFHRLVLGACRRIPFGETRSYADLAKAVCRPRAARAVGNAMARNPIPLVIPCHRVVSSAGNDCGGFSAPGGVNMKERLLELESIVWDRC